MNRTTQGAQLVERIRLYYANRRQWPTYMNLLAFCISTSPWKRLSEPSAQAQLRKGERLVRGVDSEGRVVFKITRKVDTI